VETASGTLWCSADSRCDEEYNLHGIIKYGSPRAIPNGEEGEGYLHRKKLIHLLHFFISQHTDTHTHTHIHKHTHTQQ
jgi:hypothetical protein